MDYFAGLDVSVKETSVCIVDDAGKIVREARVASEPEALLQVLTNTLYRWIGSWTAVTMAVERSRRKKMPALLCAG
jgi:predicted NBD/HSP70 family sugar kinase